MENHFDYIVIDTSRLDLELMKAGIPPEIFWNIRRMTPDVYYDQHYDQRRFLSDGVWKVEINFGLWDDESPRSRAEYVLDETVKMLVKMEEYKKSLRSTGRHERYTITVKAGTKVYKKASVDSEVVKLIPDGISEVLSIARVPSLLGDAEFFAIRHYSTEPSFHCYGYIEASDVDAEAE